MAAAGAMLTAIFSHAADLMSATDRSRPSSDGGKGELAL
jgi:hypothetical protein